MFRSAFTASGHWSCPWVGCPQEGAVPDELRLVLSIQLDELDKTLRAERDLRVGRLSEGGGGGGVRVTCEGDLVRGEGRATRGGALRGRRCARSSGCRGSSRGKASLDEEVVPAGGPRDRQWQWLWRQQWRWSAPERGCARRLACPAHSVRSQPRTTQVGRR